MPVQLTIKATDCSAHLHIGLSEVDPEGKPNSVVVSLDGAEARFVLDDFLELLLDSGVARKLARRGRWKRLVHLAAVERYNARQRAAAKAAAEKGGGS